MTSFGKLKLYDHQIETIKQMTILENEFGGGILSHDMGLGKTITAISCMKQRGKINGLPNLIICPLSVLTHWKREIVKVYSPIKQNILIYHGKDRDKHIIRNYDYIISTYYSLVTNELEQYKWGYIAIDEAHILRNGTKDSDIQKRIPKLCFGAFRISSQGIYKWCITGTPYNNRINDIVSLFKFLGIKPYNIPGWWIKSDIKTQEACMRKFCLQKTKKGILKPAFHISHLITPTNTELYPNISICKNVTKLQAQYANMKDPFKKARLLELLCNLICVARLLSNCIYYNSYLNQNDTDENVDTDVKTNKLIELKKPNKCVICFSDTNDPMQEEKCKKIFCKNCIFTWVQINPSCPYCRAPIDINVQYSNSAKLKRVPITSDLILMNCAKVNKIYTELKIWLVKDPSHKVIIFSEFVSFLTLLKQVISDKINDVELHMFTGDMSKTERERNTTNFLKIDGKKKVLLISIKAGGVGLNLMPCSTVFLAEPNLNPFVELQAENRVHRIGQSYQVNIIRFILNDSMDTKMQKGIERKLDYAESILLSNK